MNRGRGRRVRVGESLTLAHTPPLHGDGITLADALVVHAHSLPARVVAAPKCAGSASISIRHALAIDCTRSFFAHTATVFAFGRSTRAVAAEPCACARGVQLAGGAEGLRVRDGHAVAIFEAVIVRTLASSPLTSRISQRLRAVVFEAALPLCVLHTDLLVSSFATPGVLTSLFTPRRFVSARRSPLLLDELGFSFLVAALLVVVAIVVVIGFGSVVAIVGVVIVAIGLCLRLGFGWGRLLGRLHWSSIRVKLHCRTELSKLQTAVLVGTIGLARRCLLDQSI
mmetsp:Transcript_6564/g.9344  ORF Transcript_6564/g.9344 Transcript_6564/m.9344 type:complete len:283 (+) Transcript_6564:233-1081(+)